ncbi:MAG: GNAT family N-acetyltransferase [Clostridiales bacterium]|nr:GNAT family N-acetyltransferase [Clostridiales bacterium]
MCFEIKLVDVDKDKSEISKLASLARVIWEQHFPPIIGESQVEYMIDKFQSQKALDSQISEGYIYYFIIEDEKEIGYFGIQPKSDGTLFLSKLYIEISHRGNGYARKAFEFIKDYAKENNLSSVWLTVNKHNDSTIAIYKKFGMEITKELVSDIGNGFVMDDYIFTYAL